MAHVDTGGEGVKTCGVLGIAYCFFGQNPNHEAVNPKPFVSGVAFSEHSGPDWDQGGQCQVKHMVSKFLEEVDAGTCPSRCTDSGSGKMIATSFLLTIRKTEVSVKKCHHLCFDGWAV